METLPGQTYSTFDPKLTIKGCPVKAIGAPNEEQSFRFLGKVTYHDLDDAPVRREVRAKFSQDLDVVNNAKVNGLQKAWMYQHFVVPRLTWPFTVYDFPISLAEDMKVEANRLLKNGLASTSQQTWGCSIDRATNLAYS